MFQHYIVTRFNVRSKDSSGVLKKGVSEDWMEARFKLFLNFCYPSVIKQSNKHFQWLVLFDTETSDQNKKIIDKLASDSGILVPVYIDCADNIASAVRAEIKSRLAADYVITSRLDNDDCLHQDYVANVQQAFDQQAYLALNFINGVTLDYKVQPLLGYRVHANNPFISLIEYAQGDIDTVCCKVHGAWGKIRSLKQVNNEVPLWISINHDSNIRNRYIGFGDVDADLLKSFNINEIIVEDVISKLRPNDKITSLRNRVSARFYYFLKVLRHEIRARLKIIPVK